MWNFKRGGLVFDKARISIKQKDKNSVAVLNNCRGPNKLTFCTQLVPHELEPFIPHPQNSLQRPRAFELYSHSHRH